jgi:hypothetical protein
MKVNVSKGYDKTGSWCLGALVAQWLALLTLKIDEPSLIPWMFFMLSLNCVENMQKSR